VDSASAILEREIRRRREEEGAPDTWGHGVSDRQADAGAHASWAAATQPRARGEMGRAKLRLGKAERAKRRRGRKRPAGPMGQKPGVK
jgi:hypothetical protein